MEKSHHKINAIDSKIICGICDKEAVGHYYKQCFECLQTRHISREEPLLDFKKYNSLFRSLKHPFEQIFGSGRGNFVAKCREYGATDKDI